MTAILPGLARETVEIVVCGGVPPAPPLFDDGLERPAPCFVTITAGDGELRGCVGTVEPATPRLPLEVQRNALAAALDDPRMLPVSVHELPYLHYKVDVLGEMEPVTALDQIDPARWGLLLRHPMTSALVEINGSSCLACSCAAAEASSNPQKRNEVTRPAKTSGSLVPFCTRSRRRNIADCALPVVTSSRA